MTSAYEGIRLADKYDLPELHDDGLRTDYVGNIYKCGDLLPQPHFVTLFPIQAPQPDYHRPEFFQPLPFTGA